MDSKNYAAYLQLETIRKLLTNSWYSMEWCMAGRSAVEAYGPFEEELWQGLTEKAFRSIPPKGEHSIAWILFHIARIEDITMNMLVADTAQLYVKDKWTKKLNATISHSANKMGDQEVAQLSATLNVEIAV